MIRKLRATNLPWNNEKLEEPIYLLKLYLFRATGRQRSIDISFPIHQLIQIIDGLQRIKNENDEYFDEL